MKRVILTLLLLIAAVTALSAAGRRESPALAGAKRLTDRFVTAFNKQDVNAVMRCYWKSPDLVLYFPEGMGAHGWQQARQGFQRFFAQMPGAKLALTEKHYRVAGDVVIAWGTWSLTTRAEDGQPAKMLGRYTDVRARKNGKWVYLLDHASVPLPPPPEKAP